MYLKNNYSMATDTSNPLRATCFNCHYGPKPASAHFPLGQGIRAALIDILAFWSQSGCIF